MRKITQESVEAFNNREFFKKANMEVVVEAYHTELKLHGNTIATKNLDGKIDITNAGWKSQTTKERLNGIDGVHIQQKKGVWYLNGEEWDGKWKTIN